MTDEARPAVAGVLQNPRRILAKDRVDNENADDNRQHRTHGASGRFEYQQHHGRAHSHVGQVGTADTKGQ